MKKLCSICLILALVVTLFATVPAQAATVVAKGVGVSASNGDVDWKAVKESGKADFAVLQVYNGSVKDDAFEANYANATAAGFSVGASMVLTAQTEAQAKTQANALLEALKGKSFPYAIMVYVGGSDYTKLSKSLVTTIASAALTTLEAEKYFAVLHMDYAFSNNNIDTPTLSAKHALCITSGSDNDAWSMRCTSKSGKISGVNGGAWLYNTYWDFPSIIGNAGLNNVQFGNGNWNGIAWDQRDSYWGGNWIGGGSIYDTACGILSACNAINYMTGAFPDYPSANEFILDWARYANSIGGYNPNGSATGGYRYIMYGTDVSNPPPLQTRYGSKYGFTMPITWTETWNGANYYNGEYCNNIYVNQQTALKNYLANGSVAIAHVPGHFICLADYDPATDKFLVLDSYDYWTRENTYCDGVEWVSSAKLSGGLPALTVGGFCVLQPTKANTNTTEQVNKYPYASGRDFMLYDGETTFEVAGDDATKTYVYLHYDQTQGESSLKMDCTDPDAASAQKGGYASLLFKKATNLSSYKYFGIDLYVPQTMTGTHAFKVGFYSSGKEATYARFTMSGWEAGWHKIAVPIGDITKNGSLSSVDALVFTWTNTSRMSDATYILVDNVRMTNAAITSSHPGEGGTDTPTPTPPTPEVKYGDVDGDDEVSAKDALEALKSAVGKTILSADQQKAAEVDGDGQIGAKDALEILKYVVGKIVKFPVEQ